MGWSIVSEELGEFVEILPPQKRVGEHWYLGTADAVYQNLYSIVREAPRYVVVLAGRSRLQDGLPRRCCASTRSADAT
jgi:glucose-1-phosphate adenylyltransferase